jgi:hypothetical protein
LAGNLKNGLLFLTFKILYMKTTIKQIVEAKILGTDCTEGESAEIKGYLRENWDNITPLFWSVVENFPCEYGEVENELEK